ncbi:MAG: hypothetical protein ACFFED_00395 [Candidatus Thorarchaeota archaeon]
MIKKVLCNVLLITLISSLVLGYSNGYANKQILCPANQSKDLSIDNIHSDEIGPLMKYYLRRYAPDRAQTLSSINLSIYAEDPAGVDTVIMMYSHNVGDWNNSSMITQDVGDWVNLTMNCNLEGWYETIIPVSNISQPYMWCSYLVKYAANDTLGNWRVSPLCIYVFTHSTITADWFDIELYDTPDLWYVVGTTNHTVTWDTAPDIHGQSGWPYSLYEDGHLTELWSWGGSITIDVDDLGIGDHIFELYLQVVQSKNSDTVMVHVVEALEEIPYGVSTGAVGPLTETATAEFDLLTPVLIVGSACIALLIVWMKRRTR